MSSITVEALWIYPVKSLAGIPLASAQLTPAGLAGDREWMLVDASGRFVTQRQLPQLAVIGTAWDNNQLTLVHREQSISVHIDEACTPSSVSLWRDQCQALKAPERVNRWLNEQLKSDTPLTLVRFDRVIERALDSERFGRGNTHFADAAPYLVTNQASLEVLNTQLLERDEPQIDMRRFRPNLVLSGLPAFSEQQVSGLQGQEFSLALIDPCQRCAVITVDQSTGQRAANGSPLRTLARLNPMPDKPKAPAFGVNTLLRHGAGFIVKVGDRLAIEQRDRQPT